MSRIRDKKVQYWVIWRWADFEAVNRDEIVAPNASYAMRALVKQVAEEYVVQTGDIVFLSVERTAA